LPILLNTDKDELLSLWLANQITVVVTDKKDNGQGVENGGRKY
jgi:hypothetical protein